MESLYHYCTPSTFQAIVCKKTIWLSSLSLSNDSLEGKLLSGVFERLLERDRVDSESRSTIMAAIRHIEGMCDGLGFCLSDAPDLLSQWRGYAANGQGFCVGFSSKALHEFVSARTDETWFTLNKVLYEEAEHEAAIRPTYDAIKTIIDSGALVRPRAGLMTPGGADEFKKSLDAHVKANRQAWFTAFKAFPSVFTLKTNAFSEEREWRLLSPMGLGKGTDEALYRGAENRLIPYREFSFKDLGEPLITDVILGPKNTTPVAIVERALWQHGHPNATVRHSKASYR